MIEVKFVLLVLIFLGIYIYMKKYNGKEKPKVGIKRVNNIDYFKDYLALKMYLVTIFLIVFGSILLVFTFLIDLFF